MTNFNTSPNHVQLQLPQDEQQVEQQPSIFNQFAGGLGQGFGGSFNDMIKKHIQKSALDKTLEIIKNSKSPIEKYAAVAQAPIEAQPLLAEYLKQDAKSKANESFSNVTGQFLNPQQQKPQQRNASQNGIITDQNGTNNPEITREQLATLSPNDQKFLVDQIQKQKLLEQKTKIAEQTEKRAQRAEDFAEKKLALNETKEYRTKILNSFKEGKLVEARLDRMQQLLDKGNLTTPVMAKTLDFFDMPLGILDNPDSEEFDKLSQDLIKGIGDVYGTNKILKIEVENFLRTIPTLLNSDEGKERILKNLKLLKNPGKLEYDAYKEILKENKGRVPLDLQERILEKIEPALDAFKKEFAGNDNQQPIKTAPEGTVRLINPTDGKPYALPANLMEKALQEGWKQ